MPPLAPMNRREASLTPQARGRAISEASRTAAAVKATCPLPDKERKALEKATRAAGSELGRCVEVAEVTTTNTGQFQVTLRFCGAKSLSQTSQRGGAAPTPGAMADAANQMRSRALRVQTQALAFVMKRTGAWVAGPRPLVFLSKRRFACLKAPKPITSSERRLLYLKGPVPNTPVARALVGAVCRVVENEGRGAEELAILGEIPKLPGKISSVVKTPSLQEALREAETLPAPSDADNPLSNGCGPQSNPVLSFAIPDRPFGFDFTSACDAHDAAYSTLGVTKEEADIAYLDDLLGICMSSSIGLMVKFPFQLQAVTAQALCLPLAIGYYLAVSRTEESLNAYRTGQMQARLGK